MRVTNHRQSHIRVEDADVVIHAPAQFARQIAGVCPLEGVDVQIQLGRYHGEGEPVRQWSKAARLGEPVPDGIHDGGRPERRGLVAIGVDQEGLDEVGADQHIQFVQIDHQTVVVVDALHRELDRSHQRVDGPGCEVVIRLEGLRKELAERVGVVQELHRVAHRVAPARIVQNVDRPDDVRGVDLRQLLDLAQGDHAPGVVVDFEGNPIARIDRSLTAGANVVERRFRQVHRLFPAHDNFKVAGRHKSVTAATDTSSRCLTPAARFSR